ncbi:MAG: class II glutamine amidotransferase [Chloroflexi bacterium]|jgi:predicted glutamine amidotransferase|nr:MAG: class II glutamine amidotransferase [Chloroflexota bacterium]
MCELLGMSSNVPATLNLSLSKLAEHGGFSGPHRDGWGVAYYEGPDVRLLKEADAAADSEWNRVVRGHNLRSHIVMAHVRRATMGERSYRNSQPFARELAGRMHLFAHNGWLAGIFGAPRFRATRFHPVGETDSEQAFCVLLDRMSELWARPGEVPSLDARFAVVCAFAEELGDLGPANFLYADGDALFAHGHRRMQAATSRVGPPGLVYLQRHCPRGEAGFAVSGLSIEGVDQAIALVASVPLNDEPWQPFTDGEVIAIRGGEIAGRRIPADDQTCVSS